jgi:hypothetical protein
MSASPDAARTILEAAARASLRAPSVFNTQPWKWRISGAAMTLEVDPERRLPATDPDGRLLLISCGAALHHARVALAAAGWDAEVQLVPDKTRPDVLARIRLGDARPPDQQSVMMAEAIPRRRTDRRAFGDRPISEEWLTALRRAVEAEGAYLHVVAHDDVPLLALSTERAAEAASLDPAYRAELTRWTTRPAWTGDGVPPSTAVEAALRRVPVREFAPHGSGVLPVGDGLDEGAEYVVIYGNGDEPVDLLRGGEALSALLLLATAYRLSTAPLSEAVEAAWPRHLLHGLLSGIGEPYIAVRLGYLPDGASLPATPRRAPTDTIVFDD